MKGISTAKGIIAVTPSNTVDIVYPNNKQCLGIHCNGAGNLNAVFQNGTEAVIAVSANVTYPFAIKRINLTNTTATGIFVLV